ncbi:AAA family ATPase [Kitasatospora purpeofusca]|uniref:AAA family ATPase n=1 Tax=Kitasatospora purpeofusca TaxID=67352 RepID=UPI002250F540|nr:AAA family ATPase [Kitasatospora purpeofusca]MCX4684015.1 AAA family ATPase [Kitasatospora purpeofusca]
MFVFVNGPFGVGKSTTTALLAERLPQALVINPEAIGHMLWAQLPEALRTEEFELEPLWPPLTHCMLDQAARAYDRPVIVPMTIARHTVFDRIVRPLHEAGHHVHHFTLLAPPAVIRARLRERGEGPDKWGPLSWEGNQVERCLEALRQPAFAEHIDTEHRPAAEVADEILTRTGLRPTS